MALINTDDLMELVPFYSTGLEATKKANISIENTQRQLLPILCGDTYDTLVSLQETGYLTGDWQELYDKVRQWLAWASFANYLPFSQHTDTDAGMRTFVDENSTSTSDKQLSGLIEQCETFANSYLSEIISFLNANADSFPDFKDSDCYKCSNETRFKSGFYGTGRKRKRTIRTTRLT